MDGQKIEIKPHDYVEVEVTAPALRFDGKVYAKGDNVIMKKYVADGQADARLCRIVALRGDFDPSKPVPVDAVEVEAPPAE